MRKIVFCLYVCLLLLPALSALDVSLNSFDSTYMADGNAFKADTSLTLLTGDCSDCYTLLTFWFKNQADTDFTISTDEGVRRSINLTQNTLSNLYSPPMTLDFSQNTDTDFVLSFRQLARSGVITIQDNDFSVNPMPEEPQNITFLSTKKTVATFYQGSSSNTAISFRPNTLNCTVELFSYGWPSDAGKASYLLFRVSPANYRNLTPSRYWGRAVTLVLPASCAAGFQIEKIEAPETTNYTLGAREDFGYISSRDYPLVGDAGPSKISINVLLNETVLNDSEVQLNLLELVAYEPGSNSDQLTIIFGEAGSKNFSTPQKNLQLKGTGQMQIIFEPAKMDSHFLIRYETKAVLERKTFVNLNAVDSSYTLNGNMVKDIDIFSIYVDGPPTTYVFPYFAAQSRTDFEIIDAENNVFSSKDLSAASNFTGNIQLDFTGNKNWDFALIFRLDYGKIELASDVDFALLTLDASQSVTVEIGTKNRTSVYSFVTPFNRTFPCALIQNISMSCPQISLYTGGYYRNLTTSPGKYLLYEFGEDYTDNFYASQIRSFSFSLEIPENCDVSFELTENCEGNPDLSYNTVPLGGHGFFMSDAYRQNDNFWANRPLEIEIRANDTENTTEIALNFAAFDAGFENGASVFIDFSGSNSTLNLTESTQNANFTDLAESVLISFDAGAPTSGFLLKYWLQTPDPNAVSTVPTGISESTVSTTPVICTCPTLPTAETTTKVATSIQFSIVLLVILCESFV